MPKNEGCAFGKVLEQKVISLHEKLDEIREDNKILYNHLSVRLPWWATVVFSTMTGIIGFLVNLIFKII